jgi:hypothetical protein
LEIWIFFSVFQFLVLHSRATEREKLGKWVKKMIFQADWEKIRSLQPFRLPFFYIFA